MSGYTKLFSSILASTIWCEDNDTRIVWITLMAMADKTGTVEGSVPGLAGFARLPVPSVRAALEKLSAPDPDSRSPEREGRRIVAVDGGWWLVNHGKYRAKLGAEDRREYNRIKQAEYRASKAVNDTSMTVNNVALNDAYVDIAEAEAEADPKSKKIKPSRAKPARASDANFEAFWNYYPRKVGKGAAERAWAKINPDGLIREKIASALRWQVTQPQWLKDAGQFVPHPATWLNQSRWNDEPFNLPPDAAPDDSTLEDWFDACQRLHNGACGSRRLHQHKIDMDGGPSA